MNKLTTIKVLIPFLLVAVILSISCDKEDTEPVQLTKLEVSGSVCDGIYVFDTSYHQGYKYVNEEDESLFLKTYNSGDDTMWALFKKNAIYYKVKGSGEIPPESGWTCGLGANKPNFKVTVVQQ
ncbi:MAG: hypothetical protein MI922_15735 [Bacteroidales bacterium]|nr:hypothetical protein [Bacteroidales bacterium]